MNKIQNTKDLSFYNNAILFTEQRNDALLIADELRDEIEWNENNVL